MACQWLVPELLVSKQAQEVEVQTQTRSICTLIYHSETGEMRYKIKQKKYVLGTYRYILVCCSKSKYFLPQVGTFIMHSVVSAYQVHT
jgi:hypothetical protein